MRGAGCFAVLSQLGCFAVLSQLGCLCLASRRPSPTMTPSGAPRVNAALTQGLRDFFGATYRRTDGEGTFHTLWSGDRSEISVG
jgi:hypothetical protein